MTPYILAPAADADMMDIWLYSAETWSQSQADLYTARLVQAFNDIAAGRLRGKPIEGVPSHLKVSVGSHFVVFRKRAHDVIIVRVLHQRMDLSSHLPE